MLVTIKTMISGNFIRKAALLLLLTCTVHARLLLESPKRDKLGREILKPTVPEGDLYNSFGSGEGKIWSYLGLTSGNIDSKGCEENNDSACKMKKLFQEAAALAVGSEPFSADSSTLSAIPYFSKASAKSDSVTDLLFKNIASRQQATGEATTELVGKNVGIDSTSAKTKAKLERLPNGDVVINGRAKASARLQTDGKVKAKASSVTTVGDKVVENSKRKGKGDKEVSVKIGE